MFQFVRDFLDWPGMYKIRYYHAVYEFICGGISFILNFLVIYLALYKSNKYMKTYKVIIVMNSAVDLIYNSINVGTQVVSFLFV